MSASLLQKVLEIESGTWDKAKRVVMGVPPRLAALLVLLRLPSAGVLLSCAGQAPSCHQLNILLQS